MWTQSYQLRYFKELLTNCNLFVRDRDFKYIMFNTVCDLCRRLHIQNSHWKVINTVNNILITGQHSVLTTCRVI